jgi:hypothetical protein
MSGSAGKRTKKAGGHSAIFKLEEDQSSSDSGGTSSTVQAVSTPPIGPISGSGMGKESGNGDRSGEWCLG